MGYTIAEKILAAHAGGKPVRAGDVVVERRFRDGARRARR